MSKPVSRRQFLLGKFLGILLASLLMFALLGWFFEGVLLGQAVARPARPDADAGVADLNLDLGQLAGPSRPTCCAASASGWITRCSVLPGLVMTFSEVMVLLAVAVALATRSTMVVNLATVLAIYFLANVTPVLVTIGQRRQGPPRRGRCRSCFRSRPACSTCSCRTSTPSASAPPW